MGRVRWSRVRYDHHRGVTKSEVRKGKYERKDKRRTKKKEEIRHIY